MSHAEFVIAFTGPGTNGRIDVRDLAPALLSLGQAIDAANLALNGDRQPVQVEVKALTEGSFEVSIDVILPGWEYLKSLLASEDVSAAKSLLEWIGLVGTPAASLIVLYRFLKGRKPDRLERGPSGTITVVLGSEKITVPFEVLRLYQDIAVNAALKRLLATLESDTIDRIEFRPGRKEPPSETLTRADVTVFALPAPPEETVIDDTRRLALSIRSLAFQEGNKWRLFDGQNVITATIDDQDFIARVDSNAIRFAKGDVLICEVRTIQRQTTDGLKTEHFVQRVIEHKPAQTQISLPLVPPSEAGP